MSYTLRRRMPALFGALALVVAVFVFPAPAAADDLDWVGGYHKPFDFTSVDTNFMGNNCGPDFTVRDYDGGSPGAYIGTAKYHAALDLNAPNDAGMEVYAIADGNVWDTSSSYGGNGDAVYIVHAARDGTTFSTLSGHINKSLSSYTDTDGDGRKNVRLGDQIGTIAAGANDVPAHLHFAVDVGTGVSATVYNCASWPNPGNPTLNGLVDPLDWLPDHPSAGVGTSSGVDVGLIIDSSGSMSTTDPSDLRKQGAELLVQAAPDGDYLAVVDFDESATIASSALRVPENRDVLLAAIASIDSWGLTDIGAGIETMCGALEQSPSGNPKAAILLTDGFQGGGDVGPYGNEHRCFQDHGWPIYTIGLSGGADTVLLDRIASETGGEFSFLDNADQLVGTYLVIRSRIAGSAPLVDTQVAVPDGGSSELQMNVAAGFRQMTWLNFWPGSTVEMTLRSPSGRQFDCGSQSQWVECISGPTFELLTVQLPQPGEWTVSLYGLDVPASGEQVSLVATGIPAVLGPGGTFTDDDGNVHEAFINGLAAGGITKGCNPPVNDNYCPGDSVTRAQMATFLVRALGLPTTPTDYFTDDESSVHGNDINAIAAAGITMGCNPPINDRYCPESPVTRGQMASFLVRAFALTDTATDYFSDDNGSIHERDIDRLRLAGITKGCNPPANDRYCPTGPVTRAQMATFLVRAVGLTPITPTPTSVTTASLPVGTVGTTYTARLTAIGGVPPYEWALASGALPAGLALAANGTIGGTPATAGASTFTVVATDADGGEARAEYTLIVNSDTGGGYQCWAQADIPTLECDALVALFSATNGQSWTDNGGWLITNQPCTWDGVGCSSGHVTGLHLSSNSVSGMMPTELGNLGSLEVLSLWDNALSGSIPSELGNLANLQDLWLNTNALSGPIPPELGNLTNLEWLSLHTNSLSGSVPPELGSLSNLQKLWLGGNLLSGPVPSELGNLAALQDFSLPWNSLSGPVPLSLTDLANLVSLLLQGQSGCLTAEDQNLVDFLNSYDPLWNDGCTGGAANDELGPYWTGVGPREQDASRGSPADIRERT